MNKPQVFIRFKQSILVLSALILMTPGSLVALQPSTSTFPKQINIFRPDGFPGPFTKSASNPVLNTGTSPSWDEMGVYSPSVLWSDGTYRMWFSGTDASFTSAIGYATSANGIDWTKWVTNPVLTKGAPGTWEATSVGFANVIPDGGGFKMWYTGTSGSIRRVGYATSPDGITWTKYPGNPVVEVGAIGSWDASRVSNPTVTKVGSTYHMWYSSPISPAGGIGHATSPDGINWTKDSGNPVIPGGSGTWDDTLFAPFVLYDGSLFQMWYTGCNPTLDICQIDYARSVDGSTWSKRGVVLAMGSSGDFDSGLAGYPTVMMGVPYFRMWYTGSGSDELYRIGLATAVRFETELFLPIIKK